MMKGLKKWRLFSMLAALVFFLAACGQEQISTLTPRGPVASEQFDLLILSTAIMTFVIIVVVVIYVLALMKFRRSKVGENTIPEQVEGNTKLEIVWTIVPIILLLILAVPTVWLTYKQAEVSGMEQVDEEGNKTALTVNVTAKLYWWEFEYPDLGIVTAQELVVPTGEKVYFNLKAADVKHSFWIPSIGGKLDTNVENVNKFYLEFDKESEGLKDGVFYGKCAELCGPSHALMDFKVKTLSPEDFDEWVAVAQEEVPAPSEESEDLGEQLFVSNSCIGCHATSGVAAANQRGPSLATFGDRNRIAGFLEHNEENLKGWIKNSQEYKEGNLMPVYPDLTDEELNALAAYLMGLSVENRE
ncbi:cytochrome c oxidase subunit II [Chryseomicrobium excrementi]|uniref:Cytochrome c oxidase subunit 2 n=1 Tax=Chryseomicrobium excrementi TaxID=2041346 RepID=A0A2M9F3D1_9BACL|nr:cytochrome c oxidase subunit II [Chryseomicrobium excrementi]PJK17978.1 cytochrome c oxidase subunit II [Chryseomicrobium excrementi]